MGWKQNVVTFGPVKVPSFSTIGINKNVNCFIRKGHPCGKFFGASKSCFIACPDDESLEPILELISEKLSNVGVEAIIAVKERAYGQDIFCTKICGKIIESKFCIVILNDKIDNGKIIPNANVYYEYGLMTSLHKFIIPLQDEKLQLAFNIQSHDTIKYKPVNLDKELDIAIRDANKRTTIQPEQPKEYSPILSAKTILRNFEINGFAKKDKEWFLYEVIEDTDFAGFTHNSIGSLYIGKIDSKNDVETYLDDLDLIIHRTEKIYENSVRELSIMEAKVHSSSKLIKGIHGEKIKSLNKNIKNMKNVILGFVLNYEDREVMEVFREKATELIDGYQRYSLVFSEDDQIVFGDIKVPFAKKVL